MGSAGEWLVVGVFVLFVVAVLAAAAVEGLLLALERFRRREPPRTRGRRWWRRCVLSAAALGILCIAWGTFVEPYWPEVTHTTVESPLVPAGARPIRLVHLSDFHCEARPRLEERLPALVAAERPDAIVYTGDSINDPRGLPVLRRLLGELARIAPTYVVGGNWDAWYFRGLDRFGATGVRELDGQSERMVVDGTPVHFAGVHFGRESGIDASLAGIPASELCVFLYHTPDIALDLPARGVDLLVCGHTHGGQVRLPFYGALLTLSRHGKRFEAGLYDVDGMALHVTRGVGLEGHASPRVRFLCRPEISVLEVGPRTTPARE
jgi:predicted MPP superfamily phosphohydrolase